MNLSPFVLVLCTAITHLDLGSNALRSWLAVSAITSQLPALQVLDLSSNKLRPLTASDAGSEAAELVRGYALGEWLGSLKVLTLNNIPEAWQVLSLSLSLCVCVYVCVVMNLCSLSHSLSLSYLYLSLYCLAVRWLGRYV